MLARQRIQQAFLKRRIVDDALRLSGFAAIILTVYRSQKVLAFPARKFAPSRYTYSSTA